MGNKYILNFFPCSKGKYGFLVSLKDNKTKETKKVEYIWFTDNKYQPSPKSGNLFPLESLEVEFSFTIDATSSSSSLLGDSFLWFNSICLAMSAFAIVRGLEGVGKFTLLEVSMTDEGAET